MAPQGPVRHRTLRRHRKAVPVLVVSAAVAVAAAVVPVALAATTPAGRSVSAGDLAVGRPITGSRPCRAAEGAARAVNGTYGAGTTDKWCSAAAQKVLTVDLGTAHDLSLFTVRHAEAGGEHPRWNTRDFDIAVSADGRSYTLVGRIRGNTSATTNWQSPTRGRFVRLTVLAGEQRGGGPARIHELEVYGTAPRPSDPTPPAAPPGTKPAAPSSAAPQPSTTPPTGPTGDSPQPSCFPYPRHDKAKGPHTQVQVESGVRADPQLLAGLELLWEQRWPAAWQVFAKPADLAAGDGRGVSTFVIGDENRHDGGVYEVPYDELIDSLNRQSVRDPELRGDLGMWMHEGAHFAQGYGYDDAPRLFVEGIADMIRFVAMGEDPAWKIVDAADVGPKVFDRTEIWSVGYSASARFLLWVTQHYDRSGDQYALVRDINNALNHGERDHEKLIRTTVGKSFDELLTEYRADPRINPHC
jgi:hypothetical protein